MFKNIDNIQKVCINFMTYQLYTYYIHTRVFFLSQIKFSREFIVKKLIVKKYLLIVTSEMKLK